MRKRFPRRRQVIKAAPSQINGIVDARLVDAPRVIGEEYHTVSGSPYGSHPERNTAQIELQADIGRSYVTSNLNTFAPTLRTLPQAADDIACEFGLETYEKMTRDAEIASALDTVVFAATAHPLNITLPPDIDEDHPDFATATQIFDFFQWMMRSHQDTWLSQRRSVLREALKFGSALAEQTFAVVPDGDYQGKLTLQSLHHRPLTEAVYVVDNYDNCVGIVPRYAPGLTIPMGSMIPLHAGAEGYAIGSGGQMLKGIIPRAKFWIASWQKSGNDVRGTSWLLPAYAPWWLKQQVINEFLTWLARFAQVSIWGETAPDAQAECIRDDDGNVIERKEPTDIMLEALQLIRNGSVTAVPNGAAIHLLDVEGSGDVFFKALQQFDTMITRSLLKQHLATMEGEHQSRASSETHQDILSLMVLAIKGWQAESLREDIFQPLTVYNFGEQYRHLAPYVSLGDGDGFPISVTEASQILSNQAAAEFIDVPRLLRLVGVPIKSPTQMEAEKADAKERFVMQQKTLQARLNAPPQDDDLPLKTTTNNQGEE